MLRFAIMAGLATNLFASGVALGEVMCDAAHATQSPAADYSLAKITGPAASRAYFHDRGGPRCPGEKPCQRTAYLVAGDSLIVSGVADGWACGIYVSARQKQTTVGWLPADRLTLSKPYSTPGMGAWTDTWQKREGDIVIASGQERGSIEADGVVEVETGRYIGIEGDGVPTGTAVSFTTSEDCKINLILIDNWLIVLTEGRTPCGTDNTALAGVYRRYVESENQKGRKYYPPIPDHALVVKNCEKTGEELLATGVTSNMRAGALEIALCLERAIKYQMRILVGVTRMDGNVTLTQNMAAIRSNLQMFYSTMYNDVEACGFTCGTMYDGLHNSAVAYIFEGMLKDVLGRRKDSELK